MTLTCPQCKQDQAIITQQEDSYTKIVSCLACQYKVLLKHYQTRLKEIQKQNYCYHYDYLPYIEEDLLKPCAYCKENKKLNNL